MCVCVSVCLFVCVSVCLSVLVFGLDVQSVRKHNLFVLVFGLDVTDVKLLDSRSFQADQIKEILIKTDISEELKMGRKKKKMKYSDKKLTSNVS